MAKIQVSQELVPVDPNSKSVGRYQEGWRVGKPVEDPEKLKRWGFITAKPSEYLVFVNSGRIDLRKSGQGQRVWKWPWSSVAIVPTSLQQIDFVADQITRERVGVSVNGVAVFRIVQPEIAFRVLNFTYGESAKEKLSQTLREMFIGAARRLIANLTLEQCLQNRKEAIAKFLMEEITPVVSGSGRSEDTTDQGWGVVIDTIEIQDVKILSRQVFEHLQAPYRAEIAMKAEMAELERQRSVAERRSATERQSAEATIMAQRETRILKARSEAEAAESESAEALRAEQAKARVAADELARKEALSRKRVAVEEGIAMQQTESNAALERRRQQIKQEQEMAQLRLQEEKRVASAQVEMRALNSEAELSEQAHQADLRKQEQLAARRAIAQQAELSMAQKKAEHEAEQRKERIALEKLEAEADASRQRALAEVEQMLMQGRVLRDLVTQGLPHIAAAFKGSFGPIHYTHVGAGADGGPFGMIGGAMTQVLAVAKSFGLDPAKLMPQDAASVVTPAAPTTAHEDTGSVATPDSR
jgi:flotillin